MVTIAASTRRTVYNPVVATTNFAVGFPIFSNADLLMFKDGVAVAFTVTATYVEGVSTNAVCVVSPGITGTVEIIGKRTPARTDQYTPGVPLPARDHNYSLNRLTIESQEQSRDIDRSLKAPYGSAGGKIVPGAADNLAAFDAAGGIKDSGQTVSSVASLVASAIAAAASAITQAGIATAQAVISTAQAVIATAQAGIATTKAAEAQNSVAALPYLFSTTIADADPGDGTFRLNNASIASATAAYIDNQDADAVAQTGELDSWDDSTNTVRGKLTIRSKANAAIKHTFNVTGSVVDGTGYRKLTLAYVGGAGVLTDAMPCWLIFDRAGEKGTDGSGTGDVVGPASSTNNGFVKFNGTSGKLVKDSAATIATADIGDAQVTPAKLDNGAAVSILGRSANSSGARADIAAGADDRALVRSSGALSFAQLTFAMLASAALASNGDMMAGTASKLLSAAILKSAVAYQTLTDGANIAWDMASGNNAQVVLAGNRTLSNMSNPTPQYGFVLKVTATTSTRTLTLSANYIVATGVEAFPISITTSETVYIIGFVDTAGRQIITGVIRT